MDIIELLQFARKEGASDLHVSSGESPMVRILGELARIDASPLSKETVHKMLYDILTDSQKKTFEETYEIDFALVLHDIGRFRVNAFVQHRGESIVFRYIPDNIPTFEELGLPDVIVDISRRKMGFVLVTGPTGCGKSTTLAAMIDIINSERKGHIITIEDPIEFIHESKNCLVNQRELGAHTHSFANALRSALREDPDVILVGEMRDLETISLALIAAETGHLVLSTVHTSSAPKTVDRIIDVFPSVQQSQVRTAFSESILAIFSQNLIKRVDRKGRVPAVEILIGIPSIRNLIREGRIAQIATVLQTNRQYSMQTMDYALKELYQQGIVEKEEIINLLSNPSILD
ncbi:MAG: type IV pilus twitching motility protein PilT [Candidatus Brocadiales bacterium]